MEATEQAPNAAKAPAIETMSSSPTSSPPGHRRFSNKKRTKLRNTTFIIPTTGERSRRQISLRTSDSLPGTTATPWSFRSFLSERLSIHHVSSALGQYLLGCVDAAWALANSEGGRDVFKCSLAYLFGSLATFWSPLSDFLGHRDGKHIVATLTVYFHPARTAGSMLEAVLMGIIAVLYAEVVSILAMAVPTLLRSKWDILTVAHVIVIVVFIGGGLGFVGWAKHRLNSPLSNVASTLASIAIITIVTKEDAVHWGHISSDKLSQVFKMLVIGMSITAGVNVLIWPKSARNILRDSTITASVSLGDMLSMITQGFLNGSEEELGSPGFTQVSSRYASSHAQMSKCLREVKYEQYFLGREELYRLESTMVKALESVAQAIGGLRSASDTQFALLRETAQSDAGSLVLSPGSVSPTLTRAVSLFLQNSKGRSQSLASIDESAEREIEAAFFTDGLADPNHPIRGPLFRTPSDIFELFIALLGPSVKSLVWTLSEILRVSPFETNPDYNATMNDQLRHSLQEALKVYNESRGNALQELYRSIELGRSRSEKTKADIEEVAAACGHFSFSLLEVARKMDAFLDVVEDLRDKTLSGKRRWTWLKFWTHFRHDRKSTMAGDPEADSLLSKPVQRMRKSALPKGIPDTMVKQRDNVGWDSAPGAGGFIRVLSQKAMRMLRVLARDDLRFAIKVGVGAVIWASLAFMPYTKPIYMHWRGEWGLLSYMIVVSMTKGASNTTGIARFIGTMAGAVFSITGWVVGRGNAVALAFIGWLVSLANFYFILVVGNAPLGRIALLCYNVTVLYAYSLSQQVDDDDDDEGGETPAIVEICFHRVVSVTLGILWGIIVCRIIWPISGRRKFREGLAVLYLQLGLIWKRGPLAALLDDDMFQPYMRAGEQAALQRYASKLDDLRKAAESEFSLRGPFPVQRYSLIMKSTIHVLDSLYAMKLLAERRQRLSEGERALLNFTAPEREQLRQRVCHIFQVLASSLMLEYPLTDAVPSIVGVKDRLLGKIYRFRTEIAAPIGTAGWYFPSHGHDETDGGRLTTPTVSQEAASTKVDDAQEESTQSSTASQSQSQSHTRRQSSSHGRNESRGGALVVTEHDYALLYAYTLVTAQVASQLANVQREIEALFGVLHEDSLLLQ